MHTRTTLAIAAFVLPVTACGDQAAAPRAADPAPVVVPSPEPAPSLAGFPLDHDYADRNEDGTLVEVTDRPGYRGVELCGRTGWDPRAGALDLVGVEFQAPEWARGRTLVVYGSEQDAAGALAAVRATVEACPEEAHDGGSGVHTPIAYSAGDGSFGWIDRWSVAGVGYDTGLAVHHVVRVGRALLASYEYGEANGSADTRHSAIARAARADEPVVAAMAHVG